MCSLLCVSRFVYVKLPIVPARPSFSAQRPEGLSLISQSRSHPHFAVGVAVGFAVGVAVGAASTMSSVLTVSTGAVPGDVTASRPRIDHQRPCTAGRRPRRTIETLARPCRGDLVATDPRRTGTGLRTVAVVLPVA